MSEMDHTPGCAYRELAVGWALHCLEPAEESFFGGHLPNCEDCLRTVTQTEEVGVALALAAPDVAPPADLERRVLDAARATQHRDLDDPAATTGPIGGDTEATAPVVPLRRRAHRAPQRTRLSRVLTAAAAVGLVAMSVGLGVRVVQLDGERDQLAGRAAELSSAMDQAADPDAERVSLLTPDGTPVAMVLTGPERTTLVPVELAANQVGNQIYVLWGLGNGAPVALDAFDVAADAPVVHTVGSAPQAGAFTGYAVSLEPGQTPPAAPSDVLANGQVES